MKRRLCLGNFSMCRVAELDTVSLYRKGSKIRSYATGILCLLLLTNSWLSYAAEIPANLNVRVAEYLIKAEQALAKDRLTTPVDDNAMLYIEQALLIEPKHPLAIHLLQWVTKRYGELVTATLRRGEQIRQRSLIQAQTFRERAHAVINKHHVSDVELRNMDRTIAAYSVSNYESAVTGTEYGGQETSLEELLDRHIKFTELALDAGKYNDAQWHIRQADALLNRYGLSNPRLRILKQEANSVTQVSRHRNLWASPPSGIRMFGTF